MLVSSFLLLSRFPLACARMAVYTVRRFIPCVGCVAPWVGCYHKSVRMSLLYVTNSTTCLVSHNMQVCARVVRIASVAYVHPFALSPYAACPLCRCAAVKVASPCRFSSSVFPLGLLIGLHVRLAYRLPPLRSVEQAVREVNPRRILRPP